MKLLLLLLCLIQELRDQTGSPSCGQRFIGLGFSEAEEEPVEQAGGFNMSLA